ncbi:MAG: PilZ domain-containing protein, partial [Terriglobia bacterium]
MENLRSVLSAHEEKMSRAGLAYESHADILDREFWSAVPESGKRSVLLSHEAWCIPHRNLEQFLRQLLKQGDHETADAILLNYASCLHNPDREARRRTAIGLTELAGLYAGEDSRLIEAAIRHAGRQLGRESDPELQTLTSAAFVRLSQEATTHHHYGALEQTLAALENVAQVQPSLAHSVRPRIGVENRLPELIEEALQVAHVPEALLAVLQRVREPTTLQLAQQLSRCERREERERVVQLAKDLGTEATAHLSETLRTRPASEAAVTAGLLSRLDSPALEETLPQRLRGWNRHYHDVVVRLIAAGGALNRGHVLLKLVDVLDHSVLPMALDEIGMCGDVTATLPLMRLAGGELLQSGEPYLRIKAVEALGRLREPTATPLLRRLVEAKQVWRWVHPRELRLVAAQALLHIDPEWAQACLPRSGLPADELAVAPLDPVPDDPWVRQRRYPRHSLPRTLAGTANCPRGDSQLTVKVLSLGGGLAASERPLPPGTEAKVTLHYGLRHLNANTLVRAMRSHQVGFEISEIDLAERTKLRRLLTGLRPV